MEGCQEKMEVVVFVFNLPPTAKVIMETGPQLKVTSDRLVKPGIEPVTPGLQGKRFIHYTTAGPKKKWKLQMQTCRMQ